MTGIYRIADNIIRITSVHPYVHQQCADYAVAIADGQVDLDIITSEEDIRFESLRSDETRQQEGLPPYQYPDDYLESLAVYRQMATKLLKRQVLLFHGSAIAVDGKAYIFTAKSGTGKSTHTRLWRKMFGERVMMVNDDKPMIHIGNPSIVYGTPWDGKHHLSTNTSVPLHAVCILERGEKNEIEPLEPKEAAMMLLQQAYEATNTPENLLLSLQLVDGLARSVKLFRLRCNMDPEAALVAYNGMKGE